VLRSDVEFHRNDLMKAQNDVETSESDAFAAPGLHLASSGFGLTAEFGFSRAKFVSAEWLIFTRGAAVGG